MSYMRDPKHQETHDRLMAKFDAMPGHGAYLLSSAAIVIGVIGGVLLFGL